MEQLSPCTTTTEAHTPRALQQGKPPHWEAPSAITRESLHSQCSVQSLSCIWLFATSRTAVHQASLSITNSQSLFKLMSIELEIQPPHPLLSPVPTINLSQHQGLFQWVSSLHQVAKVLELQLQHQSSQWIFRLISFRMDWLDHYTSSVTKMKTKNKTLV